MKSGELNEFILRVKVTVIGHEEDHIEYYIPYEKIVENAGTKLIQN